MRANSLTNLGVALDYNVASDYDKVLVLSGIASEIEELAPHANEIATLVANLPDVLTVQEASELKYVKSNLSPQELYELVSKV